MTDSNTLSASVPGLIGAALLLLFAVVGCGADDGPALVVEAGPHDRYETVVAFDLPPEFSGAAVELVDDGDVFAVQTFDDGRGRFVLDALPAGQTRTFRIRTARTAQTGVAALDVEGVKAFEVGGSPVLDYQFEPTDPPPGVDSVYRRGGYIHPVYTPSGLVITDDYPEDHLHHHGIWAAWTNTVYEGRTPDFWNMGAETGTVVPVALDSTWGGPVHGGFRSRHRYVDLTAPEPETVLHETWTVHVYNVDGGETPYWLFDLDLEQVMAGDSLLLLPEYRYGGVGFRGHGSWLGEENTFFLTSEGRDRSDGHATRARWCHIGGLLDGGLAGVAILGHPENFRAPQPMRIHPREPFFNWAPSQAGDWTIEPGEPYRARYRYVVSDGPPNVDLIERLWNDYADPPVARVEP